MDHGLVDAQILALGIGLIVAVTDGVVEATTNCQVADGREVAAGIMLDRNAEEVSK